MKNNARAANATALPAEGHPDRRTLLTSGAAAALIASTARALPAGDPDADLLALRELWCAARVANTAALDIQSKVEQRTFARWPAFPVWETWQGNWTSYNDEYARIAREREAIEEEEGKREANRASAETLKAESAIVDRIAAIPARTMAGLRFKIEVSADWDHDREDIRDAIMADVLAFAAAHPTLALPV